MDPERVLLTADKEIPGQKWALLSFVSPEEVLKNKDRFFFEEFVKNYDFEFKTKNLEGFLASNILKINDHLETKAVEFEKIDLSGSAELCRNSKIRVDTILNELQDFLKKSAKELNENKLKDAYDTFVETNSKRLESEFYVLNNFQTSTRGLKIRGVFEYREEAATYASKLIKDDPVHNILIGEIGKWIPWDPNVNEIADQEYADEQLNSLMKKKRENEEQKAAFFRDKNVQRPDKVRFSVSREENETVSNLFNSGDLALERKMKDQ